MHYTSIENIHKVIDPLFLDDLKAELAAISEVKAMRTREQKLVAFRNKLSGLVFLDKTVPGLIQKKDLKSA